MWPLPALGCLCLLALLGMFAAQQHRESELRLLTAQQELAQQQARIQDLQRQLRQCKTRRRPSSSLALSLASPASVSAPSNLSLSAGLEHVSEATLAAAELVQTEMHAGLAAESPGWCVCPPPPNYTRVCSALHPPVADEAAAAAREAERQRGEAERLRGIVARDKLRLLRSEELLALARAELAAGAPHEGARGGGKRRGGKASQQGQKVPRSQSPVRAPTRAEQTTLWPASHSPERGALSPRGRRAPLSAQSRRWHRLWPPRRVSRRRRRPSCASRWSPRRRPC